MPTSADWTWSWHPVPTDMEDLHVRGDPTRIHQILVNLIANALKFTEQGSVSIQARWQALDSDLLWFTCTVRDTERWHFHRAVGANVRCVSTGRQLDLTPLWRYGPWACRLPA